MHHSYSRGFGSTIALISFALMFALGVQVFENLSLSEDAQQDLVAATADNTNSKTGGATNSTGSSNNTNSKSGGATNSTGSSNNTNSSSKSSSSGNTSSGSSSSGSKSSSSSSSGNTNSKSGGASNSSSGTGSQGNENNENHNQNSPASNSNSNKNSSTGYSNSSSNPASGGVTTGSNSHTQNNPANGGSNSNSSGLNSAGYRASGAGPGASGNTVTSQTGELNSSGYRATGAGPGASANTVTTKGTKTQVSNQARIDNAFGGATGDTNPLSVQKIIDSTSGFFGVPGFTGFIYESASQIVAPRTQTDRTISALQNQNNFSFQSTAISVSDWTSPNALSLETRTSLVTMQQNLGLPLAVGMTPGTQTVQIEIDVAKLGRQPTEVEKNDLAVEASRAGFSKPRTA